MAVYIVGSTWHGDGFVIESVFGSRADAEVFIRERKAQDGVLYTIEEWEVK